MLVAPSRANRNRLALNRQSRSLDVELEAELRKKKCLAMFQSGIDSERIKKVVNGPKLRYM